MLEQEVDGIVIPYLPTKLVFPELIFSFLNLATQEQIPNDHISMKKKCLFINTKMKQPFSLVFFNLF
jgi:hypothetical protein